MVQVTPLLCQRHNTALELLYNSTFGRLSQSRVKGCWGTPSNIQIGSLFQILTKLKKLTLFQQT